LVVGQPVLVTFLTALTGLVLVLDADRRIVWASQDFLKFVKVPVESAVLGRRPGEALGCVHAGDSPLGCGASEACYLCGAVDSILESKRQDMRVTRTGNLEVEWPEGRRFLDLEVSASPWILEERPFTILTIR